MNEIVTVYATFGSHEDAVRVARALVEEGIAACANILAPCRSIYRWQGKVEEAEEVPALFKVAAAGANAAIARIGDLHSYDVPAAVVWPIAETSHSYREWVLTETTR
ncbi:MAG: divalent-cation tolerance protein CutA [Pseudomonadota bacterium]|nr:divalent-cation tolerance protein CutA [Pseudomonadota bacterium]